MTITQSGFMPPQLDPTKTAIAVMVILFIALQVFK
jgi:hypothetical protein